MAETPVEKHTRPEPPSAIGEKKAAHQLTDAQIERDFLSSFQSPEPTEPVGFIPPHIPEPKGPQQYVLPRGTVIYDEEGREVNRLERDTLVNGSWSRPSQKQGGPAPRFSFEEEFPLGRENAGKRLKGIAKRTGNLWFGQTTEANKKKR